MATGGEVPGQNPARTGSEDLDNLKCHLCLEDGNVHEAVGMCIDCNDYLCEPCYNGHTRPRPLRNHQLIDKEQMLQGQIRASTKDTCTEKCEVHEDEVIKYYCTRHGLLGCTVCVTLGHTTCKDVHYIPHVSKELENNDEYKQAEARLKSALDTFKKVSENVTQNSEEVAASCAEAVGSIREFRRSAEDALRQMEAEMIEKVEAIKAEQMKELAALGEKYRAAQEELGSALGKMEALQNAQQNCTLFTEMMRMNEKLSALDSKINEAMSHSPYHTCQIRFSPNLDTLELLKDSDAFGNVSESTKVRNIVQANHLLDLNAKIGPDKSLCWISGICVLPNDRLVLTDYKNANIKVLNVKSGQTLTELSLSSKPWDITAISSKNVAVTVPRQHNLAIVKVDDNRMSIDRTVNVSGGCWGVDYRNAKLAVSLRSPDKVEIINLQGAVLHTFSSDNMGTAMFNQPHYLTYGQDDTTLYVSNAGNDTVLSVKLDGTIVATLTDKELKYPVQPAVASNGDVLVCSQYTRRVHQFTKDCKKIRHLLTPDDGLDMPLYSICLDEKNDVLYAGMCESNNVKVYKLKREPQ